MIPILVDCEDRSYFVDQLEEITGKPRSYWARYPLWFLKQIYLKKIRRKERESSCVWKT